MSKRVLDSAPDSISKLPKTTSSSDASSARLHIESTQQLVAEALEKARKVQESLASFSTKKFMGKLDQDGNLLDEHGKIVKLEREDKIEKKIQTVKTVASVVTEKVVEVQELNQMYVDPRMPVPKPDRKKRAFHFYHPGEFVKQANEDRLKLLRRNKKGTLVHALELDNPVFVAELAKEGRDKAADAMDEDKKVSNPYDRQSQDSIPVVEWWDEPLLDTKGGSVPLSYELQIMDGIITCYIEHPSAIKPLAEAPPPPPMSLVLTKDERKKIKKLRREEKQKEITDKIRLGIIPPPEPRVKLSNMMRVVAAQAVADPSAMEAKIKAAADTRVLKHQLANEERKLTAEEKAAKLKRKWTEDTSLESHVVIFRIADLTHAEHKFKVDMNARQLNLTGVALLVSDMNLVIVEGGPKAIKFFKKLMLRRIKWDSVDKKEESESEDEDENEPAPPTSKKCRLVWEGTVKTRSFQPFRFESCKTEILARKSLADRGVAEYFDLAKNIDMN